MGTLIPYSASTKHKATPIGWYGFAVFAAYVLLTSNAYAQFDALCNAWGQVDGQIGRGIATLAIASLGIGASLGKISWGLSVTVAVGIAVMLNADTVAGSLGFDNCGISASAFACSGCAVGTGSYAATVIPPR